MSSLTRYTAIYVVLFVLATAQVFVEQAGLSLRLALVAIMGLSFVKALIVAGYYQHLKFEPRAVSAVMAIGLLAALALTFAAAFSIL